MVEALAELAVELVWAVVEYAFDWQSGKADGRTDDDAIARYADSLYEERPLPPANP